MNTVLAAIFVRDDDREQAITRLRNAGIPDSATATFYRSAEGQPVSPSAPGLRAGTGGAETPPGSGAGRGLDDLAGTNAGVPTAPLGGSGGTPIGAGIGAGVQGPYQARRSAGATSGTPERTSWRRGGAVVAVQLIDPLDDPDLEKDVMNVLLSSRAVQIEKGAGLIRDGDWVDYDPARPVDLLLDSPD